MASKDINELTKEVLRLTEGKDLLESHHDLVLAVEVIKKEIKERHVKKVINEL